MRTIIYIFFFIIGLPIVIFSTVYHVLRNAWYKGEKNAREIIDWLNA